MDRSGSCRYLQFSLVNDELAQETLDLIAAGLTEPRGRAVDWDALEAALSWISVQPEGAPLRDFFDQWKGNVRRILDALPDATRRDAVRFEASRAETGGRVPLRLGGFLVLRRAETLDGVFARERERRAYLDWVQVHPAACDCEARRTSGFSEGTPVGPLELTSTSDDTWTCSRCQSGWTRERSMDGELFEVSWLPLRRQDR